MNSPHTLAPAVTPTCGRAALGRPDRITSLPPAWPLFAGLGPLGALLTVPRLSRAFCRLVLAGWGLADLAETCELITSELTSNVIRTATDDNGDPRYGLAG